MRRILVLAAIVALLIWRARRLDAHDREHGHGAYAPVDVRVPPSSGSHPQ